MAEQKVELRKTRDLGENLNDTFSFIRQNFKSLLTSFIGIAGIVMLANTIVSSMYQSRLSDVFSSILTGRNNQYSPFSFIGPGYYLMILLSWVNYIAMNVVIACYVKLYASLGGEQPTINEVWEVFRKYFLKVFLYTIPIFLLTFFGLIFCLLPGIYLAVIFVPFTIVIIEEDQTFSGAWHRCFNLIKDNFWPSLGVYFVVYLIYSFSAGIISALIGLFAGLISYFTTKDIGATIVIVTSVLNIFSFVFYVVFYVSVCLHYFNLVERHDATGMIKRLDSLGGGGNNFNNIEEQY